MVYSEQKKTERRTAETGEVEQRRVEEVEEVEVPQ